MKVAKAPKLIGSPRLLDHQAGAHTMTLTDLGKFLIAIVCSPAP